MMKMPKLPKLTKRLQVTARTLSETGSPDFAPAQPTAKIGSAFILAFSCHLLLILGMFSFHKIRAGRIPPEKVASAKTEKSGGEKSTEKASLSGGPEGSKSGAVVSGGDATAAAARAALAMGAGGVAVAAVAHSATQPPVVPPKAVVSSSAGAPAPVKAEALAKPESTEVKASSRTYVVKTGDNPVRIAKTLGVKLEDLQALNGIDDPKKLKIGQTLKVPESVKVERPVTAQAPSANSSKTANVGSKNASASTKSTKSSLAASKSGTKGTSAASKK